MRTRTVAILGVAALAVGAAVVLGNEQLRRSDTAEPRPSSSTSIAQQQAPPGVLDPAAQRYLDAVTAKSADALAAAFAPDGLVVDVAREIRGRDAIRQWAANEVIGGVYTLLDHIPRPGGVTLLVRFQPGGVGGFRANYHFDIVNGLITRATLEYA